MGKTASNDDRLDASLAETFELLAWEIELAGARCIRLDALIGAMMDKVPEHEQAALADGIQAVDLLSQHLTGLSAFARRMGGVVPSDMTAPVQAALDEITLGALADRMSSALGGADRGIVGGEEAGDLDLF
jgi:hypothetical protein